MIFIPLILGGAFFFIIKLANLGIRLSDTNVYYYTALKLLEGKVLYKDIFFTNLPLFPYLSSVYLFISGKNILVYYFTSTIEVLSTSFFIYLLLKSTTKNPVISSCGFLLYLFSFMILATTDHQTGVFLASFFSVVSYYFFIKNKYLFSGIFIGLVLCLKAYFLPILLAYITYMVLKKTWQKLFYFLIGFAGTALLIIGPFLLFAKSFFIAQTFGYSLHRAAGLSKLEVFSFVITHDSMFVVLFIFSLFNMKRDTFLFLVSVFSLLFLILYQDIYYLYLNFLLPFLAFSLPYTYTSIEKLFHKKIDTAFIAIIILISTINFVRYANGFSTLGKINDIDQLTRAIKKESPEFLYGVDSLTPALAAISNTPLIDGIIDTNENIFRSGNLDKNTMTSDALKKKTIIVARGVSYPSMEIEDQLFEGIFDKEKVAKKCKLLTSQPILAEGAVNRINLFRCY